MLPTTPPSSDSGFQALLKNKNFMVLWSGQVLSQVADKVFLVLLVSLLDQYRSPKVFQNSMYSALMMAFTLPAILFGSAGGVFVDRFPKKQIMIVADLIRAALTLAIPLLPREFLVLLALTFFISTVTQIFTPAEQAAIPLVVRRENLMAANAMFTTTMMGSLIVGFAVGEPVLSLVRNLGGESGQEFFVAILYFLAAGLGCLVTIQETLSVNQHVKVNAWHEFKQGLSYLLKNRPVKNAMVQLTILYSVFAALTVIAIPLAREVGLKETQFGFLLASAGVGLVFGAGILGHWAERFHHKPLPLMGFLSMGFVLAVFTIICIGQGIGLRELLEFGAYSGDGAEMSLTIPPRVWMALGLSSLLGFGASLIGVPMQTLIQQETPESKRGKVFGLQNNLVNIALGLPLAIAGPLTDALGLRWVLLAMAIIVSVVGVWAWRSTRSVLQDAI